MRVWPVAWLNTSMMQHTGMRRVGVPKVPRLLPNFSIRPQQCIELRANAQLGHAGKCVALLLARAGLAILSHRYSGTVSLNPHLSFFPDRYNYSLRLRSSRVLCHPNNQWREVCCFSKRLDFLLISLVSAASIFERKTSNDLEMATVEEPKPTLAPFCKRQIQ